MEDIRKEKEEIEYEEVDTAETEMEANYLIAEYRVAFGCEWILKIVQEQGVRETE